VTGQSGYPLANLQLAGDLRLPDWAQGEMRLLGSGEKRRNVFDSIRARLMLVCRRLSFTRAVQIAFATTVFARAALTLQGSRFTLRRHLLAWIMAKSVVQLRQMVADGDSLTGCPVTGRLWAKLFQQDQESVSFSDLAVETHVFAVERGRDGVPGIQSGVSR
jgi:hypothetical protein